MAINGRNYGSSGPSNPTVVENRIEKNTSSKALNLGKVFGIMFIWLLLTAGIAFLGGYLSALWLNANQEAASKGLLAIMIGSGISLLIMTFVIQFAALKKGKGMLVCSIIYVILMGILLSSFTLYIPWNILGTAFGITTAIFGVLALVGLLAKGRMTGVAVIAMMLIIGGAICSLFTWIAILIFKPNPGLVMWYWILDFAIFAGMLLMIIVDINQISKIAERGEMSGNITLYCALNLYTDFVYIFIKIVYYLALLYGKNN